MKGRQSPTRTLPRSFYDRETVTVARELLGQQIVHVVDGVPRVGRIVETEAYLGVHDLAAHSARGRTPRTDVMFGPPGYAYVYLIYGMHHCLNVVTEAEGHASAVLIRALEPVQNVATSTKGPGLLCRALAIDRALNRHDLLSADFYVAGPEAQESFEIVTRPRIGVDYAGEWAAKPLRFYVAGNPFVSRK
ncbi:MAG: DNA-3-methyladenine glycosylase [Isosphaeraceae bacterium]|nr:DNA-3-methyladenine glycosylase [Isosphaeraceae bacterium]